MSGIIYWRYGFGSENANRQTRKIVNKEIHHTKNLRAVLDTFNQLAKDDKLDFEETWEACNKLWKQKCNAINKLKLISYYANVDYFEQKYPYNRVEKIEVKPSVGILTKIWKHIDKLNK